MITNLKGLSTEICDKRIGKKVVLGTGTFDLFHYEHLKYLEGAKKQGDILVVAIGKPLYIDASYVKKGATVVDVGIHRDENNKLCGDVDFQKVEPVCGAITPVPGGVGPMTIAMLMKNCVEAMKKNS